MFTFRSVSTVLPALLLVAGLGCQQSVPRGSTSGRIDPSITTDAERSDARILPVGLMEFSDQVAQQLAQDLADLPELGGQGVRATVILGDINNKTQIVASDEFEMARSRIRNSLLSSKYVRGRISWVENRARLASLAAREGVGTVNNPAGPNAYDPRHTFTLNMDVYRLGRGQNNQVNQYYLEAQIVSFQTNEIIFSDRYEIKQQR